MKMNPEKRLELLCSVFVTAKCKLLARLMLARLMLVWMIYNKLGRLVEEYLT